MARQTFFSFHYKPDCARAGQVRNIGAVEGNKPVSDNDWESITRGGDQAISNWIAAQMKGRSCTVVLVGAETANRKWINHEIVRSWEAHMGVVGIHVHGLKNFDGQVANMGSNPFDYLTYGTAGKKLSAIVKCYNPTGATSKERYDWISQYLSDAVEEAIRIRNSN